jgi:hypothetical protein
MRRKTQYFDARGYEVSDDEALRNGCLRDGYRLSVPLTVRDAASPVQRAIMRDAARRQMAQPRTDARAFFDAYRDRLLVVDSRAPDDPFAMSRPGFRTLDCDFAGSAKRDAYADYERRICDAWKNEPTPTGVGERGVIGQREGDLCTINGRSGHLRMMNGELRCVADQSDMQTVEEWDERTCPDANLTVDEIAAAHRQRMDRIYADHAHWLSEQWKGK